MIVFNLSCAHQHHFDGWFRSTDDFEQQAGNGMIACPICGDAQIAKLLSAPRINRSMSTAATADSNGANASSEVTTNGVHPRAPAHQDAVRASMIPGLQEHMLKQFKQFVVTNTENVGGDFAETARKMHYGEEQHRNIRGRVSREESQALREEGIETVGLPPGIFLDEGVQ